MFEKLLSLFERLVIAVETIAGAGVPASGANAPAAEGPKPSRSRTSKKDDKEPATDGGLDFLGTGATTPPAKKYERGDVKAALEKLVAKSGSTVAFSLFSAAGGVSSLNDLPEASFATVIEAVEKELAKK